MTYNLFFRGYWLDTNVSDIPNVSGVYLVYRCHYDEVTKTVSLLELIYIGQSEDVNERLKNHEKKQDFVASCGHGEELCYSFAEVAEEDLKVVEDALIYAQKPQLNKEGLNDFNHTESVSLHLEGRCKLMKYQDFSIK